MLAHGSIGGRSYFSTGKPHRVAQRDLGAARLRFVSIGGRISPPGTGTFG
jgi:hypothetical protein